MLQVSSATKFLRKAFKYVNFNKILVENDKHM